MASPAASARIGSRSRRARRRRARTGVRTGRLREGWGMLKSRRDQSRGGWKSARAPRAHDKDSIRNRLAAILRRMIQGVRIGHWSDREALTGCTAILLPEGAVASGEVRGGAPATREWALLDPLRSVANGDAVMLCGGSAFGLAAADGAVRWLEERGGAFPTPAGRVPIVVAAALFPLDVGD